MRIISYNVNGLRAAINKGFYDWVAEANPEVLCIQETKAHKEQVDTEPLEKLGYHHYWYSAEKKGYSGVAIFSKKKPLAVTYGTGIKELDGEGRIIRADFENYSIISLYVPSATNLQRLDFKLNFCNVFSEYIFNLKKKKPNLIICGDYNICREAIDIHDPVRLKNTSGFLPVEREWFAYYLSYCEMIDTFRIFSQEPQQYTWWSYRTNARANNKGWRIDYQIVSENLKNKLKRSVILSEVKHSDHCPILLEIED